jgi:hypothetical protein
MGDTGPGFNVDNLFLEMIAAVDDNASGSELSEQTAVEQSFWPFRVLYF